jgi:hypothetical protein
VYIAQSAMTPVPSTSAPTFETTPMAPMSSVSTAPGRMTPSPPLYDRTPPPPSRPPSSVDTTLAGERAPGGVTTHSGAIGLVIACLFVGALASLALFWRAGFIGRGAAGRVAASASSVASAPLPPARELEHVDPPSTEPPRAAPTAIEVSPVPPLSNARPSAPAGVPQAAPAVRVSVDASNPRPGVGQPVDFVAHAGGRAKVEGARFVASGPGLAGTELSASDEGGGEFRTTFTFFQAGRYDVAFTCRLDGNPASATRSVTVGTPAPAPAPSPSPPRATPPASPASSANWL